jgi:hypothetical protein
MKTNDFYHVLVMLTSMNNTTGYHCGEDILGCDYEKNPIHLPGIKPLL